MARRYKAKPNTWFVSGTDVRLIEYLTVDKDNVKYGVFEGLREKLNGDIVRESEVCSYEEFEIIDE